MRVQVYWNITKRIWSVRDKATGRVIRHDSCLRLKDCKFTVQPGGRARVLREKVKNIHAFVEGEIEPPWHNLFGEIPDNAESVTYNPYKHETFVKRADGTAVHRAPEALLTTVFRPGINESKVPDVLIF